MNNKALNFFLSEDNIKEHLEHLRYLRLKYSVLIKSFRELEGMGLSEILKMSLNKNIKEEAIELLWQIKSHELFFYSFVENPLSTDKIRKENVSKERFLYDIMTYAQDKDYGFLYVYKDKQNNIVNLFTDHYDGAFAKYQPILCIDLYEHTYFLDYRFKKDKFLRNALAYFDLGRL